MIYPTMNEKNENEFERVPIHNVTQIARELKITREHCFSIVLGARSDTMRRGSR